MSVEDDVPVDKRTKSQKMGDAPSKKRTALAVPSNVAKVTSQTKATRVKQTETQDLMADYGVMSVLNLVELARNAKSETVKFDANKFIYEAVAGKSKTMSIDSNHAMVPSFTIVFGDHPATIVQTIDADFKDSDAEED